MRRPRVRVRRMGSFSLNRLIPNILTLLALCAGMTAIRLALNEHFEAAVVAIVVAAVLDGIDGRIARLLKATSRFGAELDSLSDFVSFGVAPALVLFVWTAHELSTLGWVAALLLAVCCALRLARFNTQIGAELPPYAYSFFTGIPAPAGALLSLFPMALNFEFGGTAFRWPYFVVAVMAAIAALMVSRVPTFSFKRLRLPPEWVMPVLLAVGALAAFMTTEPWATLLVIGALYLISIPLSIRSYAKLRRASEAMRALTREAPEPPPVTP